jgi:hypothetical protein
MHTRIALCSLVLALTAADAPARAAEMVISEARVSPSGELGRYVAVRDVRAVGDTVTGRVVNVSDKPVQNVKLLVSYNWLWDSEFHPGTDDPSQASYETIPGELAPGEEKTFSVSAPSTFRSDGRFEARVKVASMVVIERQGASASQ